VYCRDCPRWDDEKSRCQDGKVNPQKYSMAVDVANVLGVRSICVFNDYRERLIRGRSTQALGPTDNKGV
jgi:hypothetical protein